MFGWWKRWTRRRKVTAATVLMGGVVVIGGGGLVVIPGGGSEPINDGGSTASCSPACTNPAGYSSFQISVADSNGPDARTVTRTVSWAKPANIVCGTASCPLIVNFAGASLGGLNLAANKWVTILISNNWHCLGTSPNFFPEGQDLGDTVPCASSTANCANQSCSCGCGQHAFPVRYADNGVVAETVSGGAAGTSLCNPALPTNTQCDGPWPNRFSPANCGQDFLNTCDDVPFVKAAIDAVACPVANGGHCLGVDPGRIYAIGGSKGGDFTFAAMCDVRLNHYFTAAAGFSYAPYSHSSANDQSAPSNCPVLFGQANPNLPSAGLASDQQPGDFAFMDGGGDFDTSVCQGGAASNCMVTGWARSGRWSWSFAQTAGDSNPTAPATTTGSQNGSVGHNALGCPLQGPTTTTTGLGTGGVGTLREYTGCTHSDRAVVTLTVHCTATCHSFPGMDAVAGSNFVETQATAFFTKYGGP